MHADPSHMHLGEPPTFLVAIFSDRLPMSTGTVRCSPRAGTAGGVARSSSGVPCRWLLQADARAAGHALTCLTICRAHLASMTSNRAHPVRPVVACSLLLSQRAKEEACASGHTRGRQPRSLRDDQRLNMPHVRGLHLYHVAGWDAARLCSHESLKCCRVEGRCAVRASAAGSSIQKAVSLHTGPVTTDHDFRGSVFKLRAAAPLKPQIL